MSIPKICGFMSSISHSMTTTRSTDPLAALSPTIRRSTFGTPAGLRSPAP